MGAHDISFIIEGKANKAKITKCFREQQELDRNDYECDPDHEENNSYTGDFQTVHTVDFQLSKPVFADLNTAMDFCLDRAEKWSTVVAVYYQEGDQVHTLVAGWGAC